MSQFKYYLVDNGRGASYEVYRGVDVDPSAFPGGGLWRAKKDGSWSDAEAEIRPLLNLWMKGDFDPEEDEVSEQEAMAQLDEWRTTGSWPSRE